MFELIRNNFLRRFDSIESKPQSTISPSKKRHSDEDDVDNRVKHRRTDTADQLSPRHRLSSSEQFLVPFRETRTNRKMAASTCNSSMNSFNGNSSTGERRSSRIRNIKENVIVLNDDDDEEEEPDPQILFPKSEVKQWLTTKLFPESETFGASTQRTMTVDIEKKRQLHDEVEIVDNMESLETKGKQNDCTIIRCSRSPKPISTAAFYKSKPNRLRNFPTVRSGDRTGALKRPTAFMESFRLEEKKKYSQLLQTFIKAPCTNSPWRVSDHNKTSSVKEAKPRIAPKVEIVDLTKPSYKDHKNKLFIERKKNWPLLQASKADMKLLKEEAPERSNLLEIKPDDYDLNGTADIVHRVKTYNLRGHLRKQQMERQRMAAALMSPHSQEPIQGVLAEQMLTYMKISGTAIDEVINLAEDETPKLPSLLPAMEKVISVAFGGPPSEVLVKAFSQKITRRDIHTLAGSNWLNDEVINYYINLLIERGRSETYPSVYGFNTFFYPKLSESGHSSLKRWTRKIDIFAHEILIVPVHLGVHWCLASIDLKEKTIRYYDSMGGQNSTCLRELLQYLQDESLDKKKQHFDTTGWMLINVKDNPHQMNGDDCGMFACMYAEFICRRAAINFSQDNMPYFRRKMVYEIITKKLLL